MRRLRILIICSTAIFFAQGCVTTAPTPSLPSPTATTDTPPPVAEQPNTRKPSAATYEDYTPTAYEAARAAGQPIFLNFYANWCPYCLEQEPRIVALFENGRWPAGVKGFRVHYNDNETEDADRASAKDFAVGYQHTYIFIGRDGKEAKRTTGTTTDKVFLENLESIAH